VNEKQVQEWRKSKAALEKMPKSKKVRRTGIASFLELEKELSDFVSERRQNGYIVTQTAIRLRAMQMAKNDKYTLTDSKFVASAGWCSRFMNRNGFCLRQRTKIAQKLPKDLEEKNWVNVDVALVKVRTDKCIGKLQKVYSFETPYIQKFQEDLKGNTFKEHYQITKNNFSLKKITKLFIDSLVENIQCRFPADDLLTSFGILAMRPISMMLKTEVDTYWDEEIDKLCTYYGEAKTVQWEISRSIEKKTSEPVIDSVKAKIEWAFLKKVVLAEKYPQGVMCKLWHLIDHHHREDFPNCSS